MHIAVEVLDGEVIIASIKGMIYLNNNNNDKSLLVSNTGYIKGTLIGMRIPIQQQIIDINVSEVADRRIALNKYNKMVIDLG